LSVFKTTRQSIYLFEPGNYCKKISLKHLGHTHIYPHYAAFLFLLL
jgi:hypothetical protein